MPNSVFIVDLYNPYRDKNRAKHIFYLNGRYWAILETSLEWGVPNLGRFEDDPIPFYLFNTFNEALEYVKDLK